MLTKKIIAQAVINLRSVLREEVQKVTFKED